MHKYQRDGEAAATEVISRFSRLIVTDRSTSQLALGSAEPYGLHASSGELHRYYALSRPRHHASVLSPSWGRHLRLLR